MVDLGEEEVDEVDQFECSDDVHLHEGEVGELEGRRRSGSRTVHRFCPDRPVYAIVVRSIPLVRGVLSAMVVVWVVVFGRTCTAVLVLPVLVLAFGRSVIGSKNEKVECVNWVP